MVTPSVAMGSEVWNSGSIWGSPVVYPVDYTTMLSTLQLAFCQDIRETTPPSRLGHEENHQALIPDGPISRISWSSSSNFTSNRGSLVAVVRTEVAFLDRGAPLLPCETCGEMAIISLSGLWSGRAVSTMESFEREADADFSDSGIEFGAYSG